MIKKIKIEEKIDCGKLTSFHGRIERCWIVFASLYVAENELERFGYCEDVLIFCGDYSDEHSQECEFTISKVEVVEKSAKYGMTFGLTREEEELEEEDFSQDLIEKISRFCHEQTEPLCKYREVCEKFLVRDECKASGKEVDNCLYYDSPQCFFRKEDIVNIQ